MLFSFNRNLRPVSSFSMYNATAGDLTSLVSHALHIYILAYFPSAIWRPHTTPTFTHVVNDSCVFPPPSQDLLACLKLVICNSTPGRCAGRAALRASAVRPDFARGTEAMTGWMDATSHHHHLLLQSPRRRVGELRRRRRRLAMVRMYVWRVRWYIRSTASLEYPSLARRPWYDSMMAYGIWESSRRL